MWGDNYKGEVDSHHNIHVLHSLSSISLQSSEVDDGQ